MEWHFYAHYCVRTAAIALSMGAKSVNIEEIVSGTRSKDSVTFRLSSMRVFTRKCMLF